MKKQYLLSLILFSLTSIGALSAQNGKITGKVIDPEVAEGLIGASVKLTTGQGGAATDLDGNFVIQDVPPGLHTIMISYTGYASKTVTDITVVANESAYIEVAMEEPSDAAKITEVVITATAKKESMSALTVLQKTSPIIADGISAEIIRRTPDRSASDVIRRVSGASIQNGKFAVIRGLNDRYNIALLNGALLSSTEPDRKAFSFDLFPSSMLDNLIVMKTANPDIPGEFAGGAIIVNTKDIPEEDYLQVGATVGINNITTFKEHPDANHGGTDWLGIDDGTRALPDNFPTTEAYQQLSKDEQIRNSKLIENDWAYSTDKKAAPNFGFNIAGGITSDPDKKAVFGTTLAFSYNNNNRLQNGLRQDFDESGQLFRYNDLQYRNNVLWGGLFNSAMVLNKNNKFILQSTYSTNTENSNTVRQGVNFEQVRNERSTAFEFTETHLLTTRLGGEHTFGERQMKFEWGGGFNNLSSEVPSLRRLTYVKDLDLPAEEPYFAPIQPGSSNLNNGGRFYSDLNEDVINGDVDFTYPFLIGNAKQAIKVGGLVQTKQRDFAARIIGFILPSPADFNLIFLPQDSIFAHENIRPKGFVLNDITNPSDKYDAESELYAGYVMFDNKFWEKFRITWGFRYETFHQQINTFLFNNDPVKVDRSTDNLLPSANLTYAINDKHQLRLSASQTVSRPEFRELSPFSFYDFNLNGNVIGNPNLTPATINNFDFRYEFYPGQNQLFSFSLFYKDFDNPIEATSDFPSAGTRSYSFSNIPSAKNYGVEIEVRKNFDFIGAGWEDLLFFGNTAFIRSELDLEGVSFWDADRALQGQSPYIVNLGLTYRQNNWGLNSTIVYNVIGDRLAIVGTDRVPDLYERRRHLLDFQLSKKIGKHGEAKFTWGDILRPDFLFYQDQNRNHKYDENEDDKMQSLNLGSTFTFGYNYRF
jgi:outer membrane receptor protein involved in Fe transport